MPKARYHFSYRASRLNPGFTRFGWIAFLVIAGGLVLFGVPLWLGHPFHAVCSSFEETFRPNLCQQRKAMRSPATHWIGAINGAQQAYFVKHHIFAGTLKDLEIGMMPEDSLYRYQLVPQDDPRQSVRAIAQSKKPSLSSYSGAVFVVKNAQGEITTVSTICEMVPSMMPPVIQLPAPGFQQLDCPKAAIPNSKFDRSKILTPREVDHS
jgi:Type IV pilin-like G and H, putative